MATGGDLVPITVYVRTDTRECLEAEASKEDRNISYVARRIIESYYLPRHGAWSGCGEIPPH